MAAAGQTDDTQRLLNDVLAGKAFVAPPDDTGRLQRDVAAGKAFAPRVDDTQRMLQDVLAGKAFAPQAPAAPQQQPGGPPMLPAYQGGIPTPAPTNPPPPSGVAAPAALPPGRPQTIPAAGSPLPPDVAAAMPNITQPFGPSISGTMPGSAAAIAAGKMPTIRPFAFQQSPEETALSASDTALTGKKVGGILDPQRGHQLGTLAAVGNALPRLTQNWQSQGAELDQQGQQLKAMEAEAKAGNLGPRDLQILQKQEGAYKQNVAIYNQRGQTLNGLQKRYVAMTKAAGDNPIHGGFQYPEEVGKDSGFLNRLTTGISNVLFPGGAISNDLMERARTNLINTGQYPPPYPMPPTAKTPEQRNQYIEQKNTGFDAIQRLGPVVDAQGNIDLSKLGQAPTLPFQASGTHYAGPNDPRLQMDLATVRGFNSWQRSAIPTWKAQAGAEQKVTAASHYFALGNLDAVNLALGPIAGAAMAGSPLAGALLGKFEPYVGPAFARILTGAAINAPIGGTMSAGYAAVLGEKPKQIAISGLRGAGSAALLGAGGAALAEALPIAQRIASAAWDDAKTPGLINQATRQAQKLYSLTSEEAIAYRQRLTDIAQSAGSRANRMSALTTLHADAGAPPHARFRLLETGEGPVAAPRGPTQIPTPPPQGPSVAGPTERFVSPGGPRETYQTPGGPQEAYSSERGVPTGATAGQPAGGNRFGLLDVGEGASSTATPEATPAGGGRFERLEPRGGGQPAPAAPEPTAGQQQGVRLLPEATTQGGIRALPGKTTSPTATAPSGVVATLPGLGTVDLRRQDPQTLHGIGVSLLDQPQHADALAAVDNHLALHEARDAQMNAAQIPFTGTSMRDAQRDWTNLQNPARGAWDVLNKSAQDVRPNNPALADRLDDAAAQVQQGWRYNFAHDQMSGNDQLAQPQPVAPPQVSPWRMMTPEEQGTLNAPTRLALLTQDLSNSGQVLDPGEPFRFAVGRVSEDRMRQLADARFDQAQQHLAANPYIPPGAQRQAASVMTPTGTPSVQAPTTGATGQAAPVSPLASQVAPSAGGAATAAASPSLSIAAEPLSPQASPLASHYGAQIKRGDFVIDEEPVTRPTAEAPSPAPSRAEPQAAASPLTDTFHLEGFGDLRPGDVLKNPAGIKLLVIGPDPEPTTDGKVHTVHLRQMIHGQPVDSGERSAIIGRSPGQLQGEGFSLEPYDEERAIGHLRSHWRILESLAKQGAPSGVLGKKTAEQVFAEAKSAHKALDAREKALGRKEEEPEQLSVEEIERRIESTRKKIAESKPNSRGREMYERGLKALEGDLERARGQGAQPKPKKAPAAEEQAAAKPERRTNVEQRKRVEQMTPEEKDAEIRRLRTREQEQEAETAKEAKLARTHPLTGLPNQNAYNEAPKKPFQVEIDADSLGWWNDEFKQSAGDAGGDAFLQATAAALRKADLEAYHVKGDEFLAQGASAEDLKRRLEYANDWLRASTVQFDTHDGRTLKFTGAEFSYGIGPLAAGDKPYANGSLDLARAKSERESAGLRAAKTKRPPGVVETTEGGGQPAGQQQLEGGAAEPGGGRAAPAEARLADHDLRAGAVVEDQTSGKQFRLDRDHWGERGGVLTRLWDAHGLYPDGRRNYEDAELSVPSLLADFQHPTATEGAAGQAAANLVPANAHGAGGAGEGAAAAATEAQPRAEAAQGAVKPTAETKAPQKVSREPAGKQPWEMAKSEFIPESQVRQEERRNYFNDEGEKLASSRLVPQASTRLPVGTWKIDSHEGVYGREIEQLREFSPSQLTPGEETGRGRLEDVERYSQWAKEGKQLPPIRVVETENGQLKITDGHRRWLAAKKARVKIRAWVSPVTDIPGKLDSQGHPMKTGLTHELAIQKAILDGEHVPSNVLADYPKLKATGIIAPAAEGVDTSFKVGDERVNGRWALYDIGQLVTSHTDDLNANPAYPAEMQPRARSRQASREQVADIAQKFDPTLMGENPLAQHGAPIVGPDAVVESGNGRTIALRQLYTRNDKRAKAYYQWLQQQAPFLGINATDLARVKNPVLVRVRTTEMTPAERVEFTRAANARETAAMGAVEQAKVDADRLTPEMMRLFDPGESGDLLAATNRPFLRQFIGTLPTAEQGALRTAEGTISQEGVRRIRNAVFQHVYGDTDALERLSESLDDPVKNITNALLRSAGMMADLAARIDAGGVYPVSIVPDLMEAVRKLASLREANQTVTGFLAQQGLFGQDLTDLQRDVLVHLDGNKRSAKRIASTLADYADLAIKAGDPSSGILFEDIAPPEKTTLWNTAVRRTKEVGDNAPNLFTEPEPGTAGGSTLGTETGRQAEGTGGRTVQRAAGAEPAKGAGRRTTASAETPTAKIDWKKPFQVAVASFDQAIAAAKKAKADRDLYVYGIYSGRIWTNMKPPPGLWHVIVHPDGTTEEIKSPFGQPAEEQGRKGGEVQRHPQEQQRTEPPASQIAKPGTTHVRAVFDASNGKPQAPKPGLVEKHWAPKWRGMTQDIEGLPRHLYGDVRLYFHRMQNGRDIANLGAGVRMLESVRTLDNTRRTVRLPGDAEPFTEFGLFNFALYMRDMAQDVKNQQEDIDNGKRDGFLLPDGITPEEVDERMQALGVALAANPNVAGAIARRAQVWDDIFGEYGPAASAVLGHPPFERKEDYFRHQVLSKLNEKQRTPATSPRVTTPNNRGFLKFRYGSEELYNSNWIEAEADVLPQMIYDTMLYKLLGIVKQPNHNIVDAVRADAKSKELEDWHEAIPEGYRAWQPEPGRGMFAASSVAAHVFQALHDEAEALITPEDLRPVRAIGRRKPEWVLKNELADALDHLKVPMEAGFKEHMKGMRRELMGAWKVYQLLNPLRWAAFNLRHLGGSIEYSLFNPSAIHELGAATRMFAGLAAPRGGVLRKVAGGVIPGLSRMAGIHPELTHWLDRGGVFSLLSMVEGVGEPAALNLLADYVEKQKGGNLAKRAWDAHWQAARMSTDVREGIVRLAHYLSYLKQMQSNPRGLPQNWGASNRHEVLALSDIRDRAWKMSNDLMGPYDEVSQYGQWLSDNFIPFWRFQEVQLRREAQLWRNLGQELGMGGGGGRIPPPPPTGGGGGGPEQPWDDPDAAMNAGKGLLGATGKAAAIGKMSAMQLWRLGRFALKAAALQAAIMAWNHYRHPNDLKDLPDYAHGSLIIGRDANGNLLYYSRLSAQAEVASWFGADNLFGYYRDWVNGHKNLAQIAGDIVEKDASHFLESGPGLAMLETLLGRTLFPHPLAVFRHQTARNIMDPKRYFFDQLSLGGLYDQVEGLPKRPGGMASVLGLKTAARGEAAWQDARGWVADFKRAHGKADGGAAGATDRSMAAYNYKLALRYGDAPAAERYLLAYGVEGGTQNGMETSLKALDPMRGLSDDEAKEFLGGLTLADRARLFRAYEHYADIVSAGGRTIQQPGALAHERAPHEMTVSLAPLPRDLTDAPFPKLINQARNQIENAIEISVSRMKPLQVAETARNRAAPAQRQAATTVLERPPRPGL